MQSVQIIQPQSPILGGPPAEPDTADGGFSQAFAEEPEAKSDLAVGGDGASFVVPPIPTWFDVAGLMPSVADTTSGTIGPASVGDEVIAADTTNTAEPAAETMVAPSGNPAAALAPTVVLQEIPSKPDHLPQTAAQTSAAGPTAPPLSDPPATDPEAPKPQVDTSWREAEATPRAAQGVEQPSGPVPAGDQTAVAEEPAEAPRHPPAVAEGTAAGRKSDGHGGARAPDPKAAPVGPRAFPAQKMDLETGSQATANPVPDDLPPMAGTRAETLPVSVASLDTSGTDTPLADIRNLPIRRAVPAPLAAKEVASMPKVEMSPRPARSEVDVSVVDATDVAPAAASAILPGYAGSENLQVPGQVLPAVPPEALSVEVAPVAFAPQADDPKGLLPGVWERLFTGILAPVLQETDAPGASMIGFTSLAGMVPPEAAPPHTDDADPAPEHESIEARPPAGADLRKAPFEGLAVLLAPRAVEPSPMPDALHDLGEDAFPSTIGPTGPVSSAAPVSGSPQAAFALPVPQIAAQISAAVSRLSDGSTELALAPEELGKVRLKLKPDVAHPDRMVVMITFERPETLELFRKHTGELADALRAAGYAGADIGFGQEGGSASGSDRHDRPAAPTADTQFRPDSPGIAPPTARLLAGASLDLRL